MKCPEIYLSLLHVLLTVKFVNKKQTNANTKWKSTERVSNMVQNTVAEKLLIEYKFQFTYI